MVWPSAATRLRNAEISAARTCSAVGVPKVSTNDTM